MKTADSSQPGKKTHLPLSGDVYAVPVTYL